MEYCMNWNIVIEECMIYLDIYYSYPRGSLRILWIYLPLLFYLRDRDSSMQFSSLRDMFAFENLLKHCY